MYRSEKELLELRAGQHEELLKRTDQEIVDLISKKATGQRKKILINWWKEECIREEEKSVKRWQEKNPKWLEAYDEEFRKKYETKNPFLKIDDMTEVGRTQTGNRPRVQQRNILDRAPNSMQTEK